MVRRIGRIAALAVLALAASCEIAAIAIPRSDPMVVVHAVLNPAYRTQLILVEESLTGRQAVIDSGEYNPANPIVSGSGVPVSGAVVTLTDESGLVMTATERLSGSGLPTGIYAIRLDDFTRNGAPAAIMPGERYRLEVVAQGKTVRGTTLVPRASSPLATPIVPFNRDRQSVNLPINDVQLARAFWIRVDAPIAPFNIFTLDQEVAISGDTRNLFTEDLLRVFVPGFLQTLTVAAVDSNLYDYYRSGNDPFSGKGLINRLEGGLGVFGSVVVVEKRQLDVTQDPTGDPIEDTFTLRSGGTESSPHTLRLYLEAKGATAASEDRLSGAYITGPFFSPYRGAVFGSRSDAAIELHILEAQSTVRILRTFRGTLSGDTLRGTITNSSSTPTYVRVGK